ncbi:MAG: carboxypeptidase regulatory-like domain-containing protein [Candidatus Aminicenantes bacterium]|nr:carboxypeptidase regulatory-like domain-containing protein [Candidatus Aminicenantes bacterium]
MFKAVRLKSVSLILIFSFILFNSPYLLTGQTEQTGKTKGKGDLIGKVYGKDGTTAVEGAIIRIKNVVTGKIYESINTDKMGTFKIAGLEEGMYAVGIVTKEGNFNVESLIGIKANQAASVTFVLKAYLKGAPKKARARVKFIEMVKEVSKIAKFFASPIGVAVIVASSAAVVYGIVKLVEKEKPVSPFK